MTLTLQLTVIDQPIRLHDKSRADHYEVDAVLESASGEVVARETRAAETVGAEDFRGIQRLARCLGDHSCPATGSAHGPSPYCGPSLPTRTRKERGPQLGWGTMRM